MTREEMNGKMVELLETAETVDDVVVFNDKAIGLVKEIAEWAKGTNFYKENRKKAEEFFEKTTTSSTIWMFMLRKIVEAPTSLHRDCVVAGYMPVLEETILREMNQ